MRFFDSNLFQWEKIPKEHIDYLLRIIENPELADIILLTAKCP